MKTVAGLLVAVALLAGCGGCSEEPEKWSPPAQQSYLVGCFETYGQQMARMGFDSGEACRCALSVLESQFTQSEFILLGEVAAGNFSHVAGLACYQAMMES